MPRLCGTAQWLPCMCPTGPCAPALPGMGQGQLQQLLLASCLWGLEHPIAKRHQELFNPDAMGGQWGQARKRDQNANSDKLQLFSFTPVPASNVPTTWHPQHPCYQGALGMGSNVGCP